MNKNCEIVQDLLFSYQDGILHKTSIAFVEEHLKNCKICKQALLDIQKDISAEECENRQIDYLKNIHKKNKRKTTLLIFLTIILIIFLLFTLFAFIDYQKSISKMEIYLKDTVTEQEIDNLKTTLLKKYPSIELTYHSKEDAFNELSNKFEGNKSNLLTHYSNEKNPFSAYFTIQANTEIIKQIDNEASSFSFVKNIHTYFQYNPYTLFLSHFLS